VFGSSSVEVPKNMHTPSFTAPQMITGTHDEAQHDIERETSRVSMASDSMAFFHDRGRLKCNETSASSHEDGMLSERHLK
jgi:hypothetical protein